jgi:hypothetical protein
MTTKNITFYTKVTETEFIAKYGYLDAEMAQEHLSFFVEKHGADNVRTETHHNRSWILVSTPIVDGILQLPLAGGLVE